MRVAQLLTLARTLGPGALKAVGRLAPLVATHPEALDQGRRLLDQLAQARAGRSPEERLRRTIAALREEAVRARDRAEAAGAPGGESERAAEWVRSADSLATALALALVGMRQGADRRRDLARVQARTDALFAEVFTATVGDAGGSGASAPGPTV